MARISNVLSFLGTLSKLESQRCASYRPVHLCFVTPLNRDDLPGGGVNGNATGLLEIGEVPGLSFLAFARVKFESVLFFCFPAGGVFSSAASVWAFSVGVGLWKARFLTPVVNIETFRSFASAMRVNISSCCVSKSNRVWKLTLGFSGLVFSEFCVLEKVEKFRRRSFRRSSWSDVRLIPETLIPRPGSTVNGVSTRSSNSNVRAMHESSASSRENCVWGGASWVWVLCASLEGGTPGGGAKQGGSVSRSSGNVPDPGSVPHHHPNGSWSTARLSRIPIPRGDLDSGRVTQSARE